MSANLETWLKLERQMLQQDDEGAQSTVRDLLDGVWLAMSDDERAFIEQRNRMRGKK
jgi:hypothetical protein